MGKNMWEQVIMNIQINLISYFIEMKGNESSDGNEGNEGDDKKTR